MAVDGVQLDLVTRRLAMRFVREFEQAASAAETSRERNARLERFIASLRPWMRVTPHEASSAYVTRVPSTCSFFAAWLRAGEATNAAPVGGVPSVSWITPTAQANAA